MMNMETEVLGWFRPRPRLRFFPAMFEDEDEDDQKIRCQPVVSTLVSNVGTVVWPGGV
jgi:hypothetical protein